VAQKDTGDRMNVMPHVWHQHSWSQQAGPQASGKAKSAAHQEEEPPSPLGSSSLGAGGDKP